MLYVVLFMAVFIIGLILAFYLAKLYVRTTTNPIKKENCDYRFIQVDNVKTRSLNLGSRK